MSAHVHADEEPGDDERQIEHRPEQEEIGQGGPEPRAGGGGKGGAGGGRQRPSRVRRTSGTPTAAMIAALEEREAEMHTIPARLAWRERWLRASTSEAARHWSELFGERASGR